MGTVTRLDHAEALIDILHDVEKDILENGAESLAVVYVRKNDKSHRVVALPNANIDSILAGLDFAKLEVMMTILNQMHEHADET